MSDQTHAHADPSLTLVLERIVDVPRELVWAAWTNPVHIVKWFAPAPWVTTECQIDLQPGGMFRTVMRSPDGDLFPNVGCFLEIVPNERLIWTDALLPGYGPSTTPFMTAMITLESVGEKTRYVATAIHSDHAGRKKHEDMGFQFGWATALDQLVAYMKTAP